MLLQRGWMGVGVTLTQPTHLLTMYAEQRQQALRPVIAVLQKQEDSNTRQFRSTGEPDCNARGLLGANLQLLQQLAAWLLLLLAL